MLNFLAPDKKSAFFIRDLYCFSAFSAAAMDIQRSPCRKRTREFFNTAGFNLLISIGETEDLKLVNWYFHGHLSKSFFIK